MMDWREERAALAARIENDFYGWTEPEPKAPARVAEMTRKPEPPAKQRRTTAALMAPPVDRADIVARRRAAAAAAT